MTAGGSDQLWVMLLPLMEHITTTYTLLACLYVGCSCSLLQEGSLHDEGCSAGQTQSILRD